MGEDPIGFEGWDYNFYRYVANNPIAYRDPTGEFWVWVARGAWIAGKWIVKKVRVWVKPKPRKGEYGGPGAKKPFKPKTKDKIRDRDKNKCVFCGKKTKKGGGSSNSSEIDHAFPKSRGGNNSCNNGQNTCRTCNRQKGNKTTDEYLEWLRNR